MKMEAGGSGPNGAISKADMERLIDKATQAAPAQTIRIEQLPLKIIAADIPASINPKNDPPKEPTA